MAEPRTLTVHELADRTERGDVRIFDVRDPAEYDAGHIAQATHVPFTRLSEETADLDRSTTVVFYCLGGDRSGPVAEAFAESGWDAYSLEGGLRAWAQQGQPIEPENGKVADRSGLPPS